MAAKKPKAPAMQIATSREEAAQLVADIGAAQRRIAILEAKMNEKIAPIRQEFDESAAEWNAEIERKFAMVHGWAEAHRAELCPGDVKTADIGTGELLWRLPPPSVRVTGPEVVLERLRKLGLFQLIRTKEELNKEAILADPDLVKDVKGISISQTEQFLVKPHEAELDRAATSARTDRGAA